MNAVTVADERARVRAAAHPTLSQAALLFVGLTAVLTWPQVCHLESVPDNVDSWFNMWRLAWLAHQLPRAPWDLFSANIFYPAHGTFALSDAVLLQGVLAAPFIWLGVPVVVAYNLLVLASFLLCGVGTFLLVRQLTGRADAAVVSGIIFAFAPFRFDHYYHLELLWAQWMPLTLWMLHRTIRSGRIRDGVITGLLFTAQVFSCIYYAVFFATALAVVVPLLLALSAGTLRRRAVIALAPGALLVAALTVPYAMPYRAARAAVGERTDGVARLYSAGPRHYLATPSESLMYGHVMGHIGSHEKRLFPGFVALTLVGIGAFARRDRVWFAYAVFGVLAVGLSFGPRGLLFGWLRELIVLYRGLRVPARAAHLALLAVSVLAGYGLAYLMSSERWRRPWLGPALGGLLVAEYLIVPIVLVAVPTGPSDVYRWLRTQPPGAVAELPMPEWWQNGTANGWPSHEGEYDYLSTFHWQPLINGYSGEMLPSYVRVLKAARNFPDDDGVAALRAAGARYLVVHERLYGPATYRRVTAALDKRPDVFAYGTFDDYGHPAKAYGIRPD